MRTYYLYYEETFITLGYFRYTPTARQFIIACEKAVNDGLKEKQIENPNMSNFRVRWKNEKRTYKQPSKGTN